MSGELQSVRETVKARDEISDEDFDQLLRMFKEDLKDLHNGSGDEVEDLISDIFGLEPDYLFDEELGIF